VLAASIACAAADPNKVLRIASPDIETLDPQQYNDSPSYNVITAIFEGLYEWDYLASPGEAQSRWAPTALPEIPTAARRGRSREARAFASPTTRRFAASRASSPRRLGVLAQALARSESAPRRRSDRCGPDRRRARGRRCRAQGRRRFDYDKPIAGLRALDRYTVQLKLVEPNYPNIQNVLTTCAVAREVVEAAGGDIRARPSAPGRTDSESGSAARASCSKRIRLIAAVRFPDSNDPALAPMVKRCAPRSLPQIGVVEINVIEEDVTRLLEFDRGKLDVVVLRGEIATALLVRGQAQARVRGARHRAAGRPEPYLFSIYVNVADPVIGG
jgi:ABC-type transport system substrate-binding protein